MKVKAIITGATGMVGEGVLHECLLSEDYWLISWFRSIPAWFSVMYQAFERYRPGDDQCSQ